MENGKDIIKTFAVQSKINTRLNSTSGGSFFEIASLIINDGGYVCAAGFDANGDVTHKIVNKIDDLHDLQGSKYVQSRIGRCYLEIRQLLCEGKKVLFVGTPCQVSGLKTYLKSEYNSLYTLDLICFGVHSPKIYKAWLNAISKKHKKEVKKVYFRDKSYGYAAPNVKVVFTDLTYTEQNFLVKSYMKTFMSEYNVRPSCSECYFKGMKRNSDITLGDCWHIGSFDKSLDDNIGTTAVFVHTSKGMYMIKRLIEKVKVIEIQTQKEIDLDGKKMIQSVKVPTNRDDFFRDFNTLGYERTVNKWVPDNVIATLISFGKKTIGKNPFVKRILKELRR